MMMRPGESWHCTNRLCDAEVLVRSESRPEGVNPRCSCGSPMKKKYTSPVFRYLDFLRLDGRPSFEKPAQKVAEE
jgi:hypothetical protein